MPQIDSVTFFSQLFWLRLSFFTFYILIIRFVIPRISYILKVRSKKVSLDLQDSSTSSREVSFMLNKYDNFFSDLRRTSRQLVQQSNEATQNQIQRDTKNIFNNNLNTRSMKCLRAGASINAKKAVLLKLING